MDGTGDFMGLYLNDGFLEFAYDLGTGAAIIRSHDRVDLSEWHEVSLKWKMFYLGQLSCCREKLHTFFILQNQRNFLTSCITDR